MCGIAGICDAEMLSPADRHALGGMVASLSHRGPDDHGQYTDSHCALGHTRLAVIDPATGHQPMTNEDRSVWLVCNGQIYNYRQLRQDLIAAGHRFASNCDCEVIIHLYEQLGPACLERLNGMFAFALWDQPRRMLLLARDRLGIKPLYWHYDHGRMVFGSELKALLAAPGMPRDISPHALADYLAYTYVPAPKTIYRHVHKLLPGYRLVLRNGRINCQPYWDLPLDPPSRRDPGRIADEFICHLRGAVDERLVSDVPLGAFLSGGVDSSALVTLMTDSLPSVLTHSVGFAAERYNELPYAEQVACKLGTDHHSHIVQPDPVADLERLAWHYDEPFADSSALPTYYLAQATRRRLTVALSGDGADEILAGYRRYRFALAEQAVRQAVPAGVRRRLLGPLARIYPPAHHLPRLLRARATLKNLSVDLPYAHFLSVTPVDPSISLSLLSDELTDELHDYHPSLVLRDYFDRTGQLDPLRRCLYVDTKVSLPDDMLCKVDRASMAHALEVRTPFLDHRLVEFLASVPSEWKLRRGCGKYLLKRFVAKRLGRRIAYRPKHGFEVPLTQWLRGPLRPAAALAFRSCDSPVRDWLNPRQLREIYRRFHYGQQGLAPLIWSVMMLDQWARRFMQTPEQPQRAEPIRDRRILEVATA